MSPLAPPRLCRTSVIVALSLLTSAATADAECAWVLWASSDKPGGGEKWTPLSGFETFARCEKAQEWHLDANKQIGQRGGSVANVYCLPDTVDPRGPKGK